MKIEDIRKSSWDNNIEYYPEKRLQSINENTTLDYILFSATLLALGGAFIFFIETISNMVDLFIALAEIS